MRTHTCGYIEEEEGGGGNRCVQKTIFQHPAHNVFQPPPPLYDFVLKYNISPRTFLLLYFFFFFF